MWITNIKTGTFWYLWSFAFAATYISLTSIILCDIIGLDKLTAAFGFLTMVRGLASIGGAPAAGYIFDMTQNYDWSFHIGGAMFVIAGLLYCLLHLPYFTRKRYLRVAKVNIFSFIGWKNTAAD